jgi:hypothetical protein
MPPIFVCSLLTKSHMGCAVEAKCLDCGEEFAYDDGGGFFFHLVRCEKCGRTKSIGFQELGETHLRYIKGLSGPYCIASSEFDKNIQMNAQVEPISENEYHVAVEAFAGKCRCHGKFSLNAPPRCPKCRSTRIKEVGISLMYD